VGADLYAANEVSVTAQPSATGDDAIAIGDSAVASGANALAGPVSQASGSNSFAAAIGSTSTSWGAKADYGVALGYEARVETGATYGVAIGKDADSRASFGVAIGPDAYVTANGTRAIAIGYQAEAGAAQSFAAGNAPIIGSSGIAAVALGTSYANAQDAFAANISSNSSSYGATGSGAAAIMKFAKASSSNSGAFGFGANATNSMAYAFGAQTFATGNSSVSLGRNSLASATYSICIGNAGQNNIQSSIKFSGSQHANQGDAQIGLYPLMADTTDDTDTAMVTNHQTTPGAGTANQIVLPNNSAYAFYGTIVARQKAGDGTACAAWKVEGLIRREGSAGTTVLVNSATTVLDNTPNWGMALSADTTNGGLKVQVTGAESTNIRWTTSITTSELTYA
jgi:hypothetical protein